MPVKIRLQRHGKKGKPYFYIVAADSRTKRDGRYIERIGNYNPNTDPATIELDHDRAVDWMQKGAVPTDTARAILSYKGVLFHNHLLKGVAKGALTEDEAQKRFEKWMEEKEGIIQKKRDSLNKSAEAERDKRLAAEREVKEAREKELAAANAELSEEVAEATEEASAEEASAEAPAEEAKAEEAPAEEAKEEPKAEEAKEEPKAEEAKEEPKAEEAKEEPKAEEAKEEPKAEEAKEDPKTEEAKEEPKAEEKSEEDGKEEKKED